MLILTAWVCHPTHRACAKISASPTVADAALRDQLLARLKGVPGARYAEIAEHAQVGGCMLLGLRVHVCVVRLAVPERFPGARY